MSSSLRPEALLLTVTSVTLTVELSMTVVELST